VAGPRYVADPEHLIRRLELDGLTALFHIPSGMTHIVAPPAPQILRAISNSPADADELARRLSLDFDVEGGGEAMAARLAELEAAGLVQRA
jgi:PqqD family protein of HPr-rel-A system